jgi:hypothetical protein
MMKYERLTKRYSDGSVEQPFGSIRIGKFCDRLAELEDKIEKGTLKEEKTCESVSEMHPVDGFTCSECGISIEDYCEKEVDKENGDITYREYILRYCPNCGAKVVY